MKKNPWLIALTLIGVFFILVIMAVGAAMYTAFGERTPVAAGNSVLVLDVKGVIADSRNLVKQLQKFRDQKAIIQEMIDNVYMQFKQAVATGRHLSLEKVGRLADGRIFSGEQAVKNGLADQAGGLNEAVTLAAKLAGIKGKPEVFSPPPHHR